MNIRVLVENTAISPPFGAEHGLSLFIEMRNHRILFDLGQGRLFLENAQKMNADIGAVDLAVISHGHYDHGGGLEAFLARNDRADVYVSEHAFESHYSLGAQDECKIVEIGLKPELESHRRIQKVGSFLKLTDEILLFSDVRQSRYPPLANRTLLTGTPDGYAPDTFGHEQNMIITQGDEDILFTGCAHRGIINIIEASRALRGKTPRHVIGGFHLCLAEGAPDENACMAIQVADALQEYDSIYYTGHCTGDGGVRLLMDKLGNRVHRLSTGMKIYL